ncbi:MAG: ABC transporter substrate-binding protein [Ilumatobacteraceae bacterium]
MRHRKGTRFLAVFAGMALFASACASDDDSDTATPDETEAPAPDDGDDEPAEPADGGDDGDDAADEPADDGDEADEPADDEADEPADDGGDGFVCNREGGTAVGFASGASAAATATPATPGAPAPAPSVTPRPSTPAPGADGGTLVWAHEQEPPDLHVDDPANNLTVASWIQRPLVEGLYGVSSETTFIPELLASEAEIEVADDGTAVGSFELRDGLTWSDGTPLTSADVEFTYDVVMVTDDDDEFVYLLGDRTGYLTITDFAVESDTEFTITWSDFFSGFPDIFDRVWPSHVFADDPVVAAGELNEALRDWTHNGEILPSSGPMIFEEWNVGQNLTMVRNDDYHGSTSPDVVNQGAPAFVDGVDVRFVSDTDAQINALLADEAQVIFTQPQTAFESLTTNEDFTIASLAGPVWEHWGFNLYNTHLCKPEVREAMAFAMDKGEVMAGLYTPLFGDSLPAEGLGNVFWMSNQPYYVDQQTPAGYGQGDVESARAALESAGYTEGSDGIYEHPEDGRLTLRVGTTGGNALREIQQELLQAGFAEAGIEIEIDNVEGAAYFGERPFNPDAIECANSGGQSGNCGIWDITQFAWVGGPWPGSGIASFETGSGNNPYGFSNEEWDARAAECDTIVDEDERAECWNELSLYVTTLELDPDNGLVVLPITQKPSFYAYSNTLSQAAVSPDADSAGPLVNVVDYRFAN